MFDVILPIASFAFVTTFTPGPNNVLLLSSGLRFGFKLTLPHIAGIQFGVGTQLVLSALGFGVLLMSLPYADIILKVVGTTYLLYLAWMLRRTSFSENPSTSAKPFTFVQAWLFQFVNPKAWMLTITAGSLFLPKYDSLSLSVITLCATFLCVGSFSSCSWTVMGASIRRFLQTPFWQNIFSILMIVITLYTAFAIWFI